MEAMSDLPDVVLGALAQAMNEVDAAIGVKWDRCVIQEASAIVYGWISRVDGRSDFVMLNAQWGETTDLSRKPISWFALGYTTSSAEHSERIHEIVTGDAATHLPCVRVADVFGDLVGSKVE